MLETVVSLKNIDKHYWLSVAKQSLIGSFLSIFKAVDRNGTKREICALKDIELSINKGETIGIIGENASGKTTILRIISRITMPTRGQLQVRGKVAGLLDLGAGFHSELTGKENIYLDAALYGLGRQEIDSVYEKILEFSGLGDFINAQVKTYSQGMLVRLGFAIAIHVNPDIFLIDDSLAVGDEEFQRKCLNKIAELKEQGKTIIVVSHDLDSISRICDRGILLQAGRIVKDDSMHKVILRYVEAVGDKNSIASIDRGKLSVIFNAGKIVLLWDGKPITKNFGGYVSLQFLDKWVMSWHGQWQVLESDETSWKVLGTLNKYDIKILIECIVEDERLLKFSVKIECLRLVKLKKSGFGFMLSEKYGKFHDEQSLKDIENLNASGGEWSDVYRSDESLAPLILSSSEDIPVMKMNFAQDKFPSFNLIQNTAKDLDARVMQIQTVLPAVFLSEGQESDCVDYTLNIALLDEKSYNSFVNDRKQTAVIQSEDLKLQAAKNGMQIFYKNQLLNNSRNIIFGFNFKDKTFDLFDGQWRLEKQGRQILKIFSEFKEISLSLKLVLEIESDQLKWNVSVAGNELKAPDSLFVQAYLNEQYVKYFDAAHEGEFLSFCEYTEKVASCEPCAGFIGLCASDYVLPAVALEVQPEGFLVLQNSDFNVKSRILIGQVSGRNKLNGRIVLFDNDEQKKAFVDIKQQESGLNSLHSGNGMHLEFFNNKICIYKNDIEITQGEGLCSGVFFQGRWHESKELVKEFKKNGQTLQVRIKRKLPKVDEVWYIDFDGYLLRWSIELESSESVAGLACKAGIMMKTNFVKWMHSYENGSFSRDKEYSLIDSEDRNNFLLGVKAPGNDFPALTFERTRAFDPAGVIIQKINNSHCLMFKFNGAKEINDEFKQEVFSGNFQLLLPDKWDEYIQKCRKNNFSISLNDSFQLFVGPQEVKLISGDKKLSEKDGLRVSLITEKGDFDSHTADWCFQKIDKNRITVKLVWADAPFEQEWLLTLGAKCVLWSVRLIVKKRILLRELFVNVFLNSSFNRWLTQESGGEIDFGKEESHPVTIFDNRSSFVALCHGAVSEANRAFILNPCVNMNKWFLHLYKYHKENVVACGAHSVINANGEYLAVGSHEIFKGEISLNDDLEQSKNSKDDKSIYVLESGKLEIKICKGRIKLFWENQELTNALGMHTAFFKNNNWIDSTLSAWNLDAASDKTVISLYWNNLFAFQKWTLKIVNEQELLWQIKTEIQEEGITDFTAGLMLKTEYDCYQADGMRAQKFPGQFNLTHWEELVCDDKPIKAIAQKSGWPDILFEGYVEGSVSSNIIENSDALHSARVLKLETKVPKGNKSNPCLFSSKIRIILKGAKNGRH